MEIAFAAGLKKDIIGKTHIHTHTEIRICSFGFRYTIAQARQSQGHYRLDISLDISFRTTTGVVLRSRRRDFAPPSTRFCASLHRGASLHNPFCIRRRTKKMYRLVHKSRRFVFPICPIASISAGFGSFVIPSGKRELIHVRFLWKQFFSLLYMVSSNKQI